VISETTAEQVRRLLAECALIKNGKSVGFCADEFVRRFQWKYWAHMNPGEPDMPHERIAARLPVFETLDQLEAGFQSMLSDNKAGAI
jgi:hypothetical protein